MFRILTLVLCLYGGLLVADEKKVTLQVVSSNDSELVLSLGEVTKLSGSILSKAKPSAEGKQTEPYIWDSIKLPPQGSTALETAQLHRIEVDNKRVNIRLKQPFVAANVVVDERYFYIEPDCKPGVLEGFEEIKSKTLEEIKNLQDSDQQYLLVFGAGWCGPCVVQKPLTQTALHRTKLSLCYIDFDATDELSLELKKKYDVQNIPRMIVVKGNQVVESFVGRTPAAVLVSAIKMDSEHQKRIEANKKE